MISIAMATYNGEKNIKEQIESILNQTVKDFELIICDDASTDNTVSQYSQVFLNKIKELKFLKMKKTLDSKKILKKYYPIALESI